MAFTGVDTAQIQTWLSEAYEALHDINTGKSLSVLVDQNGERIEYNRASLSGLRKWIAELEACLAPANTASGPLNPWM